MPSPEDRRATTRVAFRIPAHLRRIDDETVYKGYVMNLSLTGTFVMLEQTVDLHTGIQLNFRILPANDCHAAGHLARIVPMGMAQGVGVELTWWNPEYENFLRNLESASDIEMMDFIHDIGRVYLWSGY
jgi:hypothetical protein